MSNIQVHCEHCNKSLYRLDGMSNTTHPGVVLYTECDMLSRDRLWDRNRHDFCDWKCAGFWALTKEPRP